MKTFEGFGLSSVMERSLARMQYTTPTPIQAKAIPLALDGRDIMGSAQTGTGKTAAFAIPLVEHLLKNEKSTALVMTPTRELGKQVMDILRQLIGPKSKIKTAFLIGGEPIGRQYAQLTQRPRLIVGTPGRINDHLERGNIDFSKTEFLVLDETDRMLDMGFSVQIDRILKHVPNDRQTLMFSATMPKNIMRMADKYLRNPERVAVGSTSDPAKNITQALVRVEQNAKYNVLVEEITARNGSIIVFMKTKHGADKMAKRLRADDIEAQAIHGDLKQNKRDRVIKEYRAKKFRVLIGTDVIARGLDIPHVEHVINHDLPQQPEDYIHRIGRTARGGASGEALCLIASHDERMWHAIDRLMNPDKYSGQPEPGRERAKPKGRNRGRGRNRHTQGGGRSKAANGENRENRAFKGKKRPNKQKNGVSKPKNAENHAKKRNRNRTHTANQTQKAA